MDQLKQDHEGLYMTTTRPDGKEHTVRVAPRDIKFVNPGDFMRAHITVDGKRSDG